jgi:SAM-dependent methyltransferase
MHANKGLLMLFIKNYPFQPATAFWRAIEVGHILSLPFPEGLGLDLGCGDGHVAHILLERLQDKPILVGLDVDPQETSLAMGASVYQRVHTASADHIPEEDETFDFVFSNCVLEHLPNLREVLAEANRPCKLLFQRGVGQHPRCTRLRGGEGLKIPLRQRSSKVGDPFPLYRRNPLWDVQA